MDAATRLALFGTTEAPVEPLALQAGPLSLRLEGTRLLAISAAGHEVWHGVAFVYRDPDWGTPEPLIDSVEHRPHAGGFEVRIRARVPVQPPILLQVEIVGDDDGRVRYEATAEPQGDIATNRTGLCVLHPLSVMGRAVEIEHDDGRFSRSSFPQRVAAWPPFMQVRAIRHEVADGLWAACRLEGDSFELEDQRNNADASFKTYGRSNLMPRPYLLRAGAAVRQSVELRLETPPASARAPASAPAALRIGAVQGALPRRGLGLAAENLVAGERVCALLRELAPIQLHIVLDTPGDTVDPAVLACWVEASGAPLRLDVRNAVGDASRLAALAQALQRLRIPIEAVAAFPAAPPTVDAVRSAFDGVAVGGGTPYFFAQANRVEDLGTVDFLSFTTSAIVHGADDASPMAGLQCLASLVETLRTRHPGLALRVGPSGLAAPRSPLGAQPASDGTRRLALARRDPRSGALYGAAWLLGHVAALAPAGPQGLSMLGLGPGDGLFTDDGQALRRCPAWFVLRELRHPARLRAVSVAQPQALAALALQRGNGEEIVLAANLAAVPIDVATDGLPAGRLDVLDAASWRDHQGSGRPDPWRPSQHPGGAWRLPPHAIARFVSDGRLPG